MRRRLYLQVYFGFLLILAAVTVAASLLHHWGREQPVPHAQQTRAMAQLLADALPAGREADPGALGRALSARAAELELDVALYGADGALLARVGDAPPLPPAPREDLMRLPRRGPPALAIELRDGRWMTVAMRRPEGALWHFLSTLGILAGLIGLLAYPLARHITRRLERLRENVERLGAGALDVRASIEGRDEIAALARSFNGAADRIERLIEAERRMLANASHELRSPLARLRVAVELLSKEAAPALREEAERDIGELDALIEDLLLGARLGAGEGGAPSTVSVDLRELLDQECTRAGARCAGPPIELRGDPALLRRLLRNLLENALRHGAGSEPEAELEALGDGGVRVRVSDRGPGVPEDERERIFEPFHRAARGSAPGGVGLGLALVREIARLHGGEARCLPRPGGGTTFEIELRGA
jgi:signal transduction histidine kinase